MRFLVAVVAAAALFAAQPASACKDCDNCPHAKDTVAQAEKSGKAEAAPKADKVACNCQKDANGACKCGANCKCEHCHPKKAEKADEKKT